MQVVFPCGFHVGSATVDASNIQPLPLEVGSLPSQSLRKNSPLKAYREGPQAWKPYNLWNLPSVRVFSRGVWLLINFGGLVGIPFIFWRGFKPRDSIGWYIYLYIWLNFYGKCRFINIYHTLSIYLGKTFSHVVWNPPGFLVAIKSSCQTTSH